MLSSLIGNSVHQHCSKTTTTAVNKTNANWTEQNGCDSVFRKVGGELPLDLYVNFEVLKPFYSVSIFHFLRRYS